MAVTYDKLLDEPLLHTHSAEDLTDLSVLDERYVNVAGDFMTGDLIFGDATKGIILRDANGVQWRVTVDTTGALVTSVSYAGMGTGLLLTLTQAN